ncbi:hypothetical protein ACJX0J_033096, partial [Zea mays]
MTLTQISTTTEEPQSHHNHRRRWFTGTRDKVTSTINVDHTTLYTPNCKIYPSVFTKIINEAYYKHFLCLYWFTKTPPLERGDTTKTWYIKYVGFVPYIHIDLIWVVPILQIIMTNSGKILYMSIQLYSLKP